MKMEDEDCHCNDIINHGDDNNSYNEIKGR